MSVAPHDSSAAQQVLSLPEILTMILDARKRTGGLWNWNQPVLDNSDLTNVIRVNRFWFEIGSRKLWARWGSIEWLLHVPPDRRQFYASKMRDIAIQGVRLGEYYREYQDVVFKRLTAVSILHYGMYNFEYVKPYLVPSMQYFQLHTRLLHSEAFSHLAGENLNLREVSFTAKRVVATPESFLRLIRRNPALKTVTIEGAASEETAASVELLSWLAHSSRLEHLQLPWCWTESASQRVAAAVSRLGVVPFSKLLRISLVASSKAFGKLVPLIAITKHLSLTLEDSAEDVLPHSLRLRNLESLVIYYRESCTIPIQSLMDLGTLSRLSVLHLHSSGRNIIKCDLSDSDCEALARRLPNLFYLRLRIKCNLSTNALESFLRHCPKLEQCEMCWPLATTDLFTSPPPRRHGISTITDAIFGRATG